MSTPVAFRFRMLVDGPWSDWRTWHAGDHAMFQTKGYDVEYAHSSGSRIDGPAIEDARRPYLGPECVEDASGSCTNPLHHHPKETP